MAEANTYYRTAVWDGVELDDLPPPVFVPFANPIREARPPITLPYTEEQLEYMAREFHDLGPGWKGTKYLGEGTAQLAVFEHAETGRSLVVKELSEINENPGKLDLKGEGDFSTILSVRGSAHIIGLEASSSPIMASDEGLGPEWDGVTRRLYLETGPLGSAQQLLNKRIDEQKFFSEATLWLFFDCLIDGCTAMEYAGGEFLEDMVNGTIVSPISDEEREDWVPVVHFDIKPDNIFLGNKSEPDHPYTPVFKMGDFGISRQMPRGRSGQLYADQCEKMRTYGTNPYYAPEQFTAGWDYKGYENDPTVGNYDWRTNVWGIGCVMWQLAMLARRPPKASEPFLPERMLNGAVPKGNTYGKNLDAPEYAYSKTLKDTIFECLYSNRTHRPELIRLKDIAIDGYLAAIEVAPIDNWADFLVPEPRDVTLYACTCRAVLQRGPRRGQACGKKAVPPKQEQRAIDAMLPRCKAHPIDRFPNAI
ncbi:kinase-like protein [Mollisia scopiformis]|uniref:non-specific serine/threonine protein kinase n=1 Tax=Mollisia scopiformis TaxID=149040 RepID=A0A194XGX4_MOLSC|nr:kinase-like protein [Mollisia scopiformis]KUJ19450.1 kinase-like protein [Mollisia scopiformis]